MKKCLLLLLLQCLVCQNSFAQDDSQARQDLEAVNSAIVEIESWLDQANNRYSDAEQRLREAELEVSTVRQAIQAIESEISATNDNLDALNEQLAELQANKELAESELAESLRAAYIAGDNNSLKILLNGESLSDAARMLHYAGSLSRYQLSRIEAFQNTLLELDQVNSELQAQLANLEAQQTELQSQELALNNARDVRAEALAALTRDISSRNQELAQLQINQAELEELIAEIARAMEGIRSFDDVPDFAASRGQMPMPISGTVVSRFGSDYGAGSLRRQGVVIASSEGTPVRAVHPGQVVFADWLRGAGLLVIIDHGGGFMSLYGRNEALSSQAGDWVDAGDVLATSGRGGEGNTSGLYFEIRRNGQALDPEAWLQPGT